MTETTPDWAEALKTAQPILANPSTYPVQARILAVWVRENAPKPLKPTLRSQILDLPHGTIFTLSEPEATLTDSAESRDSIYVIHRDEAVQINGAHPGYRVNLMRRQPDDKSAFSAWHPETQLKVVVKL